MHVPDVTATSLGGGCEDSGGARLEPDGRKPAPYDERVALRRHGSRAAVVARADEVSVVHGCPAGLGPGRDVVGLEVPDWRVATGEGTARTAMRGGARASHAPAPP